ncbi:hypothetical protein FBZ89_12289 [Nitrospirillum amazonense]|uniref:DoxX-like protein n=1 Tax=Nitrospirillum amazonense TaxID=28077 RepID=A0A560EUI7_9PROT|nr:DUF6326 family protein [Nitrospirillum amazonense]TWB12988.1 hypothetical protein FBZ89_12289 [Nitrospirillum amazonense]
MTVRRLIDRHVPMRLKLSAAWTAILFCYVYGDYFALYSPGKIQAVMAGDIGIGQAGPGMLAAVSLMMALPSVLVFLCLVLPAPVCRWANGALGIVYAAIVALTMPGAPLFYILLSAIEIALSATVLWLAWSWPRDDLPEG